MQEAADPNVPLIERFRFMGIFSNNLDEFFKVRYATVKRIAQSEKSGKRALGGVKAAGVAAAITERVIELQQESAKVLEEIEGQLVNENIHFLRENEVTAVHADFLTNYFLQQVSPALVT